MSISAFKIGLPPKETKAPVCRPNRLYNAAGLVISLCFGRALQSLGHFSLFFTPLVFGTATFEAFAIFACPLKAVCRKSMAVLMR